MFVPRGFIQLNQLTIQLTIQLIELIQFSKFNVMIHFLNCATIMGRWKIFFPIKNTFNLEGLNVYIDFINMVLD